MLGSSSCRSEWVPGLVSFKSVWHPNQMVLGLNPDLYNQPVGTFENSLFLLIKGDILYHQCVSVISRWKSDVTSGRVHLDVCWVDQSTSLPSGLQLTYPSYIKVDTHNSLWRRITLTPGEMVKYVTFNAMYLSEYKSCFEPMCLLNDWYVNKWRQ